MEKRRRSGLGWQPLKFAIGGNVAGVNCLLERLLLLGCGSVHPQSGWSLCGARQL